MRAPLEALALLAATLAALAAAAPGVAATVVPQQGIAGVSVGMTRAQVHAKLGKPVKATDGRNDFGPWTSYRYRGLSIVFQSGQNATAILTTRRVDRTVRGVGVGSTAAAVKAKVAAVTCVDEADLFHCYVGRWEPGRVVTDFIFTGGRVSRVTVGRVLD